jgi:hypothetical protein
LRTIVSNHAASQVPSRDALNKALGDYHIAVAVLRAAALAREKALIDKDYALHCESASDLVAMGTLAVDRATTIFDEKETNRQATLAVPERAVADFHGECSALQIEASAGHWACLVSKEEALVKMDGLLLQRHLGHSYSLLAIASGFCGAFQGD